MGHIPLLEELVIIAGLGVLVALVLGRLRLPTITGLLVAGVLAGPHGLGLVREREPIEVLAEIGVVLLLFSIGLEFSLSRLRRILRLLLIGGAIQVVATLLAVLGVAVALGRDLAEAVVLGCMFALSSTAIVLRVLGERREIDAPHGRFIVGVLIFQDLCVVPMVLLVPLLAQGGTAVELGASIGLAALKSVMVVLLVLAAARWVVPSVLAWVDASRSRELFLLAVLTLCIGTAWLTSLTGLSLALGAFLGGVAVSDTTYGQRALGDILPLRDAFVSIFFVSLGMLLDPEVFVRSGGAVALLFVGFVLVKGMFATLAALAMRFPARVAWLAGVGLAQFGEFGFVLLRMAEDGELVSPEDARVVMAAGILSMSVTPLLVRWAPHMTAGERMLAPLAKLLTTDGIEVHPEVEQHAREHVLLIGYGVAGRLVATALRRCELPYLALELNAEVVHAARSRGEPVFYGDATSPEALEHAGIEHARVVAILINDPSAVPRVLGAIRHCRTKAKVLVRTHYLAQRAELLGAGADEAVVEEIESGVELLALTLRRLGVARNVLDLRVAEARDETLASARSQLTGTALDLATQRERLARLRVDSVRLERGAPAIGQTLVSLALAQRTGATAFAVERDGEAIQSALAELELREGDVVHVAGTEAALVAATQALARPTSAD
jgi:CPA2 family monovalent cation:H+ antiporter-2